MDIQSTQYPHHTILIVDHDASSRALLTGILRDAGFECLEAWDISTASLALEGRPPEAILLDSVLQGTNGLEYLIRLKEDRRTCDIPVIMMSAGATIDDRVAGLERGADDFIGKPFSQSECVARLRAVLRRRARQLRLQSGRDETDDTAPVECGGLRLDPLTRRVTVGGDRYIRLGPSEFQLLKIFLRNPDRVHSRDDLLASLRGPNPAILSRTIDVYVRRIRQALQWHGCDSLLQTVHRSGYRFSGSHRERSR
ncbi:response regulator [Steroidobacter flavus]|uniref:Response regulator n=1 Tax=Steroidobacter flavus TaxID=1842136 RepID=A0ABV8T2W2_9GAMM